jgi:hypothetical protein
VGHPRQSASVAESDNLLDIGPDVRYTMKCEDLVETYDDTLVRTVTVEKQDGRQPAEQQRASARRRLRRSFARREGPRQAARQVARVCASVALQSSLAIGV